MGGWGRISIWLMVNGLWLMWVKPVGAQVVINEFLPDPSDKNDEKEWIELYNLGEAEVDLKGYILDDQEGGTKPYEVEAGTIMAKGFWVLEKAVSGIGLNNDQDRVRLIDREGQTIDQVEYEKIPPDQSYGRVPDGSSGWIILDKPTKNEQNAVSTTAAADTPSAAAGAGETCDGLKLSKVYACPAEGQNEWVEVFNPTSQAVSGEGCLIEDAAGNIRKLKGTAAAGGYLIAEWPAAILNNGGDKIYLKNSLGSITDEAEYGQCAAGQSWIKSEVGWAFSEPDQPHPTETKTKDAPTAKPQPTGTPTRAQAAGGEAAAEPKPAKPEATAGGRVIGLATRAAVLAASQAGEIEVNKTVSKFNSGWLLIGGGVMLAGSALLQYGKRNSV